MRDQHDDEDFIEETEDAASPDVDIADAEESHADAVRSAKKKLKECEEERRSLHEELQRTKADFLNSKRRLEEQQCERRDAAQRRLEELAERDRERITAAHIEELLPICDSFELALNEHAEDMDASWQKGIAGIYNQLQALLKRHGVEPIEDTNVPFDPTIHEAVQSDGAGEGSETVHTIFQKGYKRGDAVIRPARVAVTT